MHEGSVFALYNCTTLMNDAFIRQSIYNPACATGGVHAAFKADLELDFEWASSVTFGNLPLHSGLST